MSAASSTPDPAQADSQHHRDVLNDLLDAGARLARMLPETVRQVIDAEPPATAARATADAAIAYEHLSRGMRRNITLIRHLDQPVAPPARAADRIAARKRIIREVEDAIQRKDPHDKRGLAAELQERLEQPELVDEIDRRPVPDIIADICRDLGLAGLAPGIEPWKRRTPADIAALCARAAQLPADPDHPQRHPANGPETLALGPAIHAAIPAKPRLWPPAHDAP